MSNSRLAKLNLSHGPEGEKLLSDQGSHESLDSVLRSASSLLETLRAIDFHCFESTPATEAVPHLLNTPVAQTTRTLQESIRLIQILPHLVGAELAAIDNDDTQPDADVALGNRHFVEGRPAPYKPGLDASVNQALDAALAQSQAHIATSLKPATPEERAAFGILCHRAILNLREALQNIREAQRERTKWNLIATGEEARRKIRKALRATCIVAMRLLGHQDDSKYFTQDVSELEASLYVRAILMSFYFDIHSLSHASESLQSVDLGMHLREVRLRMLQLFSDPHYSELRAPDRFKLQKVFGEMNRWLDHTWEDYTQARALMQTVMALAQDVAKINNRDIIVAHDQQIQQQAIEQANALNASYLQNTSLEQSHKRLLELLYTVQKMQWRSPALDGVVSTQLEQQAKQPKKPMLPEGLDAATLAQQVQLVRQQLQQVSFAPL